MKCQSLFSGKTKKKDFKNVILTYVAQSDACRIGDQIAI